MTDAILHLGDSLDPSTGLVTLAPQSVDHAIFDPPYEAEAHTRGRRIMVGSFVEERAGCRLPAAAPIPYPAIIEEERHGLAQQVARVTRRWILVFCQSKAIHFWREALQAGGARLVRVGAWVKPDGQPQLTGDRPGVGWEAIVIAHGAKRRLRWNGGGRRAVWQYNTRDDVGTGILKGRKMLVGQKPTALIYRLIQDFTDPGDLILDPTAGSGTTGVVALASGRRFLGWERVPKHHALAMARMRGETLRPDLRQPELFARRSDP